jgi:hypothetical protein
MELPGCEESALNQPQFFIAASSHTGAVGYCGFDAITVSSIGLPTCKKCGGETLKWAGFEWRRL